jgi:hypothetical protein
MPKKQSEKKSQEIKSTGTWRYSREGVSQDWYRQISKGSSRRGLRL